MHMSSYRIITLIIHLILAFPSCFFYMISQNAHKQVDGNIASVYFLREQDENIYSKFYW